MEGKQVWFHVQDQVVLDAMKESETLSDLAKVRDSAQSRSRNGEKSSWRNPASSSSTKETESKRDKGVAGERDRLLKVGQLTVEVDFCGNLRESRPENKSWSRNVRPAYDEHRFCKLTKTNQSTFCYRKKKRRRKGNIDVMNKMDEYYEHPTAGVRTMRSMLLMQGIAVNEKRVRRLMGRWASKPSPAEEAPTKQGQAGYVHPYLLKGKKIDSPDQVWSTDITYVPMRRIHVSVCSDERTAAVTSSDGGFKQHVGQVQLHRHSWKNAFAKHGTPKSWTPTKTQYTSADWITLEGRGISIKYGWPRRCKDNIWMSVSGGQ